MIEFAVSGFAAAGISGGVSRHARLPVIGRLPVACVTFHRGSVSRMMLNFDTIVHWVRIFTGHGRRRSWYMVRNGGFMLRSISGRRLRLYTKSAGVIKHTVCDTH